ncbi:PCRF domain-containing protein, partial [Escherichia coli]|nr:PCRF domain-containing protein [Escherichia coli]
NAASEDPDLWNDAEAAQKVMRERQQLDEAVTAIKKLERDLEDGATLIELGEMEGDESSIREGEAAILAVEKEAASRQVETLLSGE